MRLCYIVDARVPHARNWISYFCDVGGYDVHVISTYPCEPIEPAPASMRVVPLDFSARVRSGGARQAQTSSGAFARLRGGRVWTSLAAVKDKMGPAAVWMRQGQVSRLIERIRPDLVHAMRIPFEGILAAQALASSDIPLVLSVWGNDFTLFAEGSRVVGELTRRALARADALHPDCNKDLFLGREWGFDPERPAVVLPGNGGVYTDVFYPGPPDPALRLQWAIPNDAPVLINPRGLRPYVRTDTFFQAIPLILAERPDAVFLGGMMQGSAVAERWVKRLGIEKNVRLLPKVGQRQMADYFRLAEVSTSPAEHDGTPNSLLEAMACGVFPVAGNIASVREWIDDGVNGLLFDPASPQSLANAALRALKDEPLRAEAATRNPKLIEERVEYGRGMARAAEFYEEVLRYAGCTAPQVGCAG